ncbi:MAG: YebC/PmpR family DNA-binding transcriptional regulator [Candidatus Magasanikbacteria bacterium]|nr:YebC/PmpR family DNA-binding transcriptional regulator [Candidatus Magasanikbacteria bacterium]
MSGHSKWHNIQARKGKQDALRSNMFTKAAKVISVAAGKGGGDPVMNFSLRLAIEKAKAAGMPKDNIERAIMKGTGESGDGVRMEEIMYEGYGPSGVALLIKTVTDNKNRTVPDIKHMLSDSGGSLGNSGSVLWMFNQFGWAQISGEQLGSMSRDDFELAMIDAGAEDIQNGEEGMVDIKTKVENFKKVLDKLNELGIEPKDSGLIWEAKDKVIASPELQTKLENLFGEFEANDDIEDWYTNAE